MVFIVGGIINKAGLKWCQNVFQGRIQKKILLWDNEINQADTRKFKIFTKLYDAGGPVVPLFTNNLIVCVFDMFRESSSSELINQGPFCFIPFQMSSFYERGMSFSRFTHFHQSLGKFS